MYVVLHLCVYVNVRCVRTHSEQQWEHLPGHPQGTMEPRAHDIKGPPLD